MKNKATRGNDLAFGDFALAADGMRTHYVPPN